MKTTKHLLQVILSKPTAPFREHFVLNAIKAQLKKWNTPYVTDSWGNVIAGVSQLSQLKNSKRVALVAHTDHPGFHLIKALSARRWTAQWHGGVPPKMLGAKLRIYHPTNPNLSLRAVCKTKNIGKENKRIFELHIQGAMPFEPTPSCFGAFDYPGVSFKGDRIHSRAADDLTGVAVILSTWARLKAKERKHFLGIFTRAEEVGFIGAIGLLETQVLGPEIQAISLEASSQLPNARIGKGPIVRLGDRKTLFDTAMVTQLDRAAKNIKHQRRIMDKGSCEATAFSAYNIRSAGLAVPLGNYHNQRSNGTPGPEFVSIHDVQGLVEICEQFYKNLVSLQKRPSLRQELKQDFQTKKSLLKEQL